MKQRTLLFILLLMTSFCVQAQKFDSNFVDGKIWFKVKNTVSPSNQKKSGANNPIIINEVGTVPLAIRQLPIFTNNRSTQKSYKFNLPSKAKPEMFPGLFYLEFKQTAAGEADVIIQELLQSGLVEYAEKQPIYRTNLEINDTYKGNQYALNLVKATNAWELVKDKPFMTEGSNIVIAVVDDAININHPDLVDVLWTNSAEIPGNGIDDDGNGYIDDYNGVDVSLATNTPLPPSSSFNHGTHVAGIAAAKSNNGIGVASLAYNARLMAIKATNEAGYVNAGYEGIIYAVENGAHIINCSWGGTGSSQVLQEIINYAINHNVMVVGAAGNNGVSTPFFPASYNGVISVANTNESDLKHSSSNYGTRVDISAPGYNIYSTRWNGGYEYKTGTSMSAPMVASLLALMKSIDPTIPNEQIKGCLINTADDLYALNPSFEGLLGSGRINAEAAVSCVLALTDNPPVADFIANKQFLVEGISVQFKNFSNYAPTSYEWSFPGGTPSTYSGANPPSIQYNTAGTYSVSLTVTNAYGTHTFTRENYIEVIPQIACEAKNLDSTWGWYNYTVGLNSYLMGTSPSRMIQEKAMFFDFSYSTSTHITRTEVLFGTTVTNSTSQLKVPLKIYDGTIGRPGALLYTDTSLTFAEIVVNAKVYNSSVYLHDKAIDLPASKKIFISIDFSEICNTGNCDIDLTLFSTENGLVTNTAWEKYGNEWYQFGFSGSYGYSGNLSIFPYVTNDPFKFDFTIPAAVCLKQDAVFDGSSINATGNWSVWFDGDVANSLSNILNPTKSFISTGEHTISIHAIGGACFDERINTQTFIVKDTPTIQHQILNSLVCSGLTTDISVSGADEYLWVAPNYIAGYNQEDLSVVLNQTETITVLGATDGCTSTYSFNVPVTTSVTSSVELNANPNYFEPNVPIQFTASGENLNGSLLYAFYVNEQLAQKSSLNTFELSDGKIGDIVNVEVSNISGCILNPTPKSNNFVLSVITLPIHFEYFDAKATGNNNEVFWKLSEGQNGENVIIEKSNDGQNYYDLAHFNWENGQQNKVVDINTSALNFYRVKVIYLDGSFEISNTLKVQRSALNQLQLYPSLLTASQALNIITHSSNTQTYKVAVINNIGQIVDQYKMLSKLIISTQGWKKGMYYIRITNEVNKEVELRKVIVQ